MLDKDPFENCHEALRDAVTALSGQTEGLGQVARDIVRAVSGERRSFHTAQHLFEVSGDGEPVETLAALFHDIVYLQVDGSCPLSVAAIVDRYSIDTGDEILLRGEDAFANASPDGTAADALAVFGLSASDSLTAKGGTNEFLSALVAVDMLGPHVDRATLIAISACIEATIPFRGDDEAGRGPMDRLFTRLTEASEARGWGLEEPTLVRIVERAARVANRDVENFCSTDPGYFLHRTWQLLPELNPKVDTRGIYTIADFRRAIFGMRKFFDFITAERVFVDFRSEPGEARLDEITSNAKRNIRIARVYLRAKTYTLALLETLASRIGDAVSISMVMGDLPLSDPRDRLESLLPPPTSTVTETNRVNVAVLELLEKGRSGETLYDIRNSPVSAYLARWHGLDDIVELEAGCEAYFSGELTADEWLAKQPEPLVSALRAAIVSMLRLKADRVERA